MSVLFRTAKQDPVSILLLNEETDESTQVSNTKTLPTLRRTALPPLARIMATMAPLLLPCIIILTWSPISLGDRTFLRLIFLRLP